MWFIDGHEDIATTLAETRRDFGKTDPRHSLSLPGLREAGAGLVLATLFSSGTSEKDPASIERQFILYRELLDRFPGDLLRIEKRADLPGAEPPDRLGLIHLLEGAHALHAPSDLPDFHGKGVRVVGLTWNHANAYAGGVAGTGGLTRNGHALLARMADLSMVLDLSHLNET
ncbi:MAG: membrane dipeptidase, partial [Planctomycetota bacterium]